MSGSASDTASDRNPIPYRAEIDGLRALAVLAVLGYHFFPGRVPHGYLGVDIFFVISGYLITGLLLREQALGGIDLVAFYARRIRRLFPALLLVTGACLAAAFLLFFFYEFERFVRHLLATLGFVENFNLAAESGYFDEAVRGKPLLHFWSLAVEEQFYLVWPFLILATGRSARLPGAALMAVLVLSLGFALAGRLPADLAFYSPLTRFWELAAGGLLAWRETRPALRLPMPRWTGGAASAGALAAIAAVVLAAPAGLRHPGWITLVPVGATLVLLAAPRALVNTAIFARRPMVAVGLISYPLYLWHWPLLAFPFVMSGELAPVPTSMRIALLAVSFALASATYWFVERPARRRWRAKPAAAWLLAAAALLAIAAVIAAPLQKSLSGPHAATIQAQLAGPSWSFVRNDWCERRYGKDYRLFCIQSRPGSPTLLLFGNSFANHLYPGFATSLLTQGHNVLSITTCDPGLTDDKGCAVQERIAASPGLKVAIVSSLWPRFDASGRMVENRAGRIVALPGQPGAARYGQVLAERLRRLRTLGLAVVLVGPKPALGYNASECFPRPMRRAAHDCRLSAAEVRAQTDATSAVLMQAAASVPGVRYFDLRPLFCGPTECNFIDGDGLPLLRDKVHFSELGSRRVAEALVRDALDQGMDLQQPAR